LTWLKSELRAADEAGRAASVAEILDLIMKKTILLVEDSKVQKLATERFLLKPGYLVLLAEDGEEGLRLARESIPDLILLDLLLPGIGGEEVLYALKRDSLTEPIPVIVVSHLSSANSGTLKAAGAADYFEKSRLLNDREGEAVFLKLIDSILRQDPERNKVASELPVVVPR
jgi:twitching motility two-component system response regulator PilH